MAINTENYKRIKEEVDLKNATLVAVSKIRTPAEILELYNLGHRDFGENYVQELVAKYEQLPKDIRWHFIGHLQANKVKYIAPFVYLIHGVDRLSLVREIDKQAKRAERNIPYLLQVHIADEKSKFGFDAVETEQILADPRTLSPYHHSEVRGLMGMATFTDDQKKIRSEFVQLKTMFEKYFGNKGLAEKINSGGVIEEIPILSMGMSADYQIALEEGSNMVRIGSLLFGARM